MPHQFLLNCKQAQTIVYSMALSGESYAENLIVWCAWQLSPQLSLQWPTSKKIHLPNPVLWTFVHVLAMCSTFISRSRRLLYFNIPPSYLIQDSEASRNIITQQIAFTLSTKRMTQVLPLEQSQFYCRGVSRHSRCNLELEPVSWMGIYFPAANNVNKNAKIKDINIPA